MTKLCLFGYMKQKKHKLWANAGSLIKTKAQKYSIKEDFTAKDTAVKSDSDYNLHS